MKGHSPRGWTLADFKENTMPQIDTYYRGYRLCLSTVSGTTSIWKDAECIDSVTNKTKGRAPTTTIAAKDLVDSWMEAK